MPVFEHIGGHGQRGFTWQKARQILVHEVEGKTVGTGIEGENAAI